MKMAIIAGFILLSSILNICALENVTFTKTADFSFSSLNEETAQLSGEIHKRIKRQFYPSGIMYSPIGSGDTRRYLRKRNKKPRRINTIPVGGLVPFPELFQTFDPKAIFQGTVGSIVSAAKLLDLAALVQNKDAAISVFKSLNIPPKLAKFAKIFFENAKKFILNTIKWSLLNRGRKNLRNVRIFSQT